MDQSYENGNSYVESLGGRDLLDKSDSLAPESENDEVDVDFDWEEQRRVAALSTAQTLNLTNVGELLLAAVQIEHYLKDGVIEYEPMTPGPSQEAPGGAVTADEAGQVSSQQDGPTGPETAVQPA